MKITATLLLMAIVGTVSTYMYGFSLSLWSDEFGPWDLLRPHLSETIQLSLNFAQHPPTYFAFLWLTSTFLGESALGLRLPSLLLILISAHSLYGTIRDLGRDRCIALFTALIWLSLPVVTAAGIFTRPYALAICCSVFSIRAVSRFLLTNRSADFVRAIIWSLLAANVHVAFFPLFGFILIAAFVRPLRFYQISVNLKSTTLLVILPLLSLLPLLHIFKIAGRKDSDLYSLIGIPEFSRVVGEILPTGLFLGLVIGFIINSLLTQTQLYPTTPTASQPKTLDSKIIFYLACLTIFPPLINLFMLYGFGQSVFFPRHFAYYSISLVMLVGLSLEYLKTSIARYFCCSLIIILCNYQCVEALRLIFNENFREAVQFVNETSTDGKSVTLAMTGYVESGDALYLSEPERVENLLAPVRYYALNTPYRIIPTLKIYPLNPELIEFTKQQVNWALNQDITDIFVISTYSLVTNFIAINCILVNDCLAKPQFRSFGNVSVAQFHVYRGTEGADTRIEAVALQKK